IRPCPEFDNMALTEAGMDFASDPAEAPPPAVFDDGSDLAFDDGGVMYRTELGRRAKWVPLIMQWAKDINKAVWAELINGKEVPGKKLVEGKSNRKYIDDAETTYFALVQAGLTPESLYTEPELKSPAQVEKIRPLPEGMKLAGLKKVVAALAH